MARSVEQTSALSPERLRCDSLKLKAQLDSQQGVRNCSRNGTVYLTAFRRFFHGYLFLGHRVQVQPHCVLEPFPQFCYSNAMNAGLEAELGKGFFARACEEAKLYFRLLPEE